MKQLTLFYYLLAGLPGFARDSCNFPRTKWVEMGMI